MPLPDRCAFYQVRLKLACHVQSSFGAHADEPDTSGGQSFYRRYPDVLSETLIDYLAFVQRDQQHATHTLIALFAAAIARFAIE